jgi:hypothetical protein
MYSEFGGFPYQLVPHFKTIIAVIPPITESNRETAEKVALPPNDSVNSMKADQQNTPSAKNTDASNAARFISTATA